MLIEIFGLGCGNCDGLLRNARSAVDELGIEARVVKVDDFEAIIRKGITMTPGLVIDGEIRSMGRVPCVEEIKEMIGAVGRQEVELPPPETVKMTSTCGCSGAGTLFYACSGGSNVGQMSNEVAKSLVDRGLGRFSCLAGVGSHGVGFINAAKKADRIVSLDGCAIKCASKMLTQAGTEADVQVVITDMGMKKDHDHLSPSREDVDRIVGLVEKEL